jgi:hypothetical protein
MKLADYQRAVVRASLALDPSEGEFVMLGDAARFRMYRSMIRSRLEAMAKLAYAGALELAGGKAFGASFARFLAEVGPASPLLRDVIAAFGAFAEDDAILLAEAPAALRDVLAFERAKWCAAYAAAARPTAGEDGVREFDFEGEPVLNPVLHRLALSHAVHEAGRPAAPTWLLVYRPAELDHVRWYAADRFFFLVLDQAAREREPFAASVRAVAEREALTIDEALVETLASSVTLALTRGVLVGSR